MCGYTLVNGTRRASITKYDALRNANVQVSSSSEFTSVCRGISATFPYSNSLFQFYLNPTQFNYVIEYKDNSITDPFDVRFMTQTNDQINAGNVTFRDWSLKNSHLRIVDNSIFSIGQDMFVLGGEMMNYQTSRVDIKNQTNVDSFVFRFNTTSNSTCLRFNQNYTNLNLTNYFKFYRVATGEAVSIITNFGKPKISSDPFNNTANLTTDWDLGNLRNTRH